MQQQEWAWHRVKGESAYERRVLSRRVIRRRLLLRAVPHRNIQKLGWYVRAAESEREEKQREIGWGIKSGGVREGLSNKKFTSFRKDLKILQLEFRKDLKILNYWDH
jgi:hypothetical protein